ncbi:MAG: hypothetical protein ACK6DS_07065, partial [Planctomycetota bacterium]
CPLGAAGHPAENGGWSPDSAAFAMWSDQPGFARPQVSARFSVAGTTARSVKFARASRRIFEI